MNIKNIKKISTILGIILLLYYWQWVTHAEDIINFSTFQKNIYSTTEEISTIQKLKNIKYINEQKCFYTKENKNTYIITPSCLFKDRLPTLDFQEAIDYMRPYIETFNTIYNEVTQNFMYEWTHPIFKKEYDIIPTTRTERIALIQAQVEGKKLRIDKSALAYQIIKNANFYVVYRDTSILKRCTKQNYMIAINILNNMIIKSWEILNLNKIITNAPWYCKWSWPQNLMFYGWVCWASTQLFRASLLSPQIKITKRYGHSEWLVPYYSEYIFGDDAAMYEMYKQFEIQNISENNLYIKSLEKKNGIFLTIITPKKTNEGVHIKKTQTQGLSAKVEKIIYKKRPELIIKTEKFTSKYIKKVYNTR